MHKTDIEIKALQMRLQEMNLITKINYSKLRKYMKGMITCIA